MGCMRSDVVVDCVMLPVNLATDSICKFSLTRQWQRMHLQMSSPITPDDSNYYRFMNVMSLYYVHAACEYVYMWYKKLRRTRSEIHFVAGCTHALSHRLNKNVWSSMLFIDIWFLVQSYSYKLVQSHWGSTNKAIWAYNCSQTSTLSCSGLMLSFGIHGLLWYRAGPGGSSAYLSPPPTSSIPLHLPQYGRIYLVSVCVFLI